MAESGVLARILQQKQTEVAALRGQKLPAPPGPRPFSLRRVDGKVQLITEIKFRSPSAGPLSTALSVAERARAYEAGGASMLSVLCDARFFDGAFTHLAEARAACSLPLLCKEFVIDELQLDAALAYGADAVLLIVRCVSPERLPVLIRAARDRGLEPFVEIVSDEEASLALDSGATLIGVNARDLDSRDGCRARAAPARYAAENGDARPPVGDCSTRGRAARRSVVSRRRPDRRGFDARSRSRGSPTEPRERGYGRRLSETRPGGALSAKLRS